MLKRNLARHASWLALGFAVVGCGSDDANNSNAPLDGEDQGLTVEVFSYWANPGAAEAFQALVDFHKSRHPKDKVINDAQSGLDWEARFMDRVSEGNSPDLYVQHSAEVAGFIERHGAESLQPLDEFVASPAAGGILTKLPEEVLADARVDGKLYAVPAGGVLRANSLFYNKQVFAANGLTPPATLDEFMTTCQELKDAEISCVTSSLMTQLFEGILAGVMGTEDYYAYRHDGTVDEAALRRGIDVFTDVVDNYLEPSALLPVPTGASDPQIDAFMAGRAAMFMVGDWMKAAMQQLGWTPGVDFDVAPPPGNAGLFVYALDSFSIPSAAPHMDGAIRFLSTSLSLEGQAAFLGADATPVRTDLQLARDPVRETIIADWQNAEHRLAANLSFAWEGPLQMFAHTPQHDKEALLAVLLSSH